MDFALQEENADIEPIWLRRMIVTSHARKLTSKMNVTSHARKLHFDVIYLFKEQFCGGVDN